MQDLSGTLYMSSRYGRLDVRTMAVPHAARALAALIREHGPEAETSPLGRALAARAALSGSEATAVVGLDGGRMLRDVGSGRFVGTIRPETYRRPAAVVEAPVRPERRPWRLLVALAAVLGLLVAFGRRRHARGGAERS